MCDDHPEIPAAYRVQGETDSFGAELIDMCEACYKEHKQALADTAVERATGMCEWCKNHATDLRRMRDFEEGTCGRLYDVCSACRKRQLDECTAELEANGYFDHNDGHYDDDYDPIESCADDVDDWPEQEDEESIAAEVGPQLPVEALPPGNARAWVDGVFIY
jgi:hypothetical protein